MWWYYKWRAVDIDEAIALKSYTFSIQMASWMLGVVVTWAILFQKFPFMQEGEIITLDVRLNNGFCCWWVIGRAANVVWIGGLFGVNVGIMMNVVFLVLEWKTS